MASDIEWVDTDDVEWVDTADVEWVDSASVASPYVDRWHPLLLLLGVSN